MLGLAFEAVEIGWAHLLPHSLWLFSVIVPGLWNMLAVQWNDPVWRGLVKIAPLCMVAIGMMILLVQKRAYPHGTIHTEPAAEASLMSRLTRGTRGLIFGIIIVIVGVTLLLDQMNLIDANRVFRFWPLALIFWGVSTLLTCQGSGRRFWGGFLILAGTAFQLQELGYQRVRMETLWPVFLIGVGVLLVIPGIRQGREAAGE